MDIYLESLGCARNQVDSETMLARLTAAGLHTVDDPAVADVIVINTCSFIESAANESIDTILLLAQYKQTGRCRRLIVTGCLPERYREPIVEALAEVDLFLGTGAYHQIVSAVQGRIPDSACLLPDPETIDALPLPGRVPFAPHAAYLKIAEGCDQHCTYCIIPKLRGRQKSRPRQVVIDEARHLIHGGARELTIVAQETTTYGSDLTPPDDLAALLDDLARLESSVWIRLMYGHPQSLNAETIKTIAKHANICSYIDVPIQHASDRVLKRMGRHYGHDDLVRLFDLLREQICDVALRTTVLVGFPGETEADFETLKTLVKRIGFEHLGVFAYSDSDDLPAHRLQDPVDPVIAQQRLDELMILQRDLSAQNLTRYLGRTLDVLLEECQVDGVWMGRTMYQAPEVDGVTFVHPAPSSSKLSVGDVVQARIMESMDYDLIAEEVCLT